MPKYSTEEPVYETFLCKFRNRRTDTENRFVAAEGEETGEGRTESLGFADVNYCLSDEWTIIRSY